MDEDITGSTANECAVKIAQKATGASDVISLFLSHHGQTQFATGISGNAFRGKGVCKFKRLEPEFMYLLLIVIAVIIKQRILIVAFVLCRGNGCMILNMQVVISGSYDYKNLF